VLPYSGRLFFFSQLSSLKKQLQLLFSFNVASFGSITDVLDVPEMLNDCLSPERRSFETDILREKIGLIHGQLPRNKGVKKQFSR
jgi:hypothetical protein